MDNKNYLPLDQIDCNKIYKYIREKGNTTSIIVGLEADNDRYYPNIAMNLFSSKSKKVSKGYVKTIIDKDHIKKYYCDKSKILLKRNNKKYRLIKLLNSDAHTYFTHDNGGSPFLVYVTLKENKEYIVRIYKLSDDYYYEDEYTNGSDDYYVELIAQYNPIEVFIGECLTRSTGECDDTTFLGNSILLALPNTNKNNKYVHIGMVIYEFETKDKIIEYHSPVGNSDVPYPFAIGEEYVYFMLDNTYVPKDKYDEIVPEGYLNSYYYYYGHHCKSGGCGKDNDYEKNDKPKKECDRLGDYAKKMISCKLIQKRVW